METTGRKELRPSGCPAPLQFDLLEGHAIVAAGWVVWMRVAVFIKREAARITASAGVESTDAYVGYESGGYSNSVALTGVGTFWSNQSALVIGRAGSFNRMSITGAARMWSGSSVLGETAAATGNVVTVGGASSLWHNTGDLVVGNAGAGNQLTVGGGGTVTAGQRVLVGLNAASPDNRIELVGGYLSAPELQINTGTVVMTDGELQVNRLTNPGAAGGATFLWSGGTIRPKRDDLDISAPLTLTNAAGATFSTLDTGWDPRTIRVTGVIGETGGSQGFSKTGAGTLILEAHNTFSGTAVIRAGTLLVNGSLASNSTVTVHSAAIVGGTGDVGRLQLSAGIYSPGNSSGTQTVAALYFTNGAFRCDLAGDGRDLVKVTDEVRLSAAGSKTELDLDVNNFTGYTTHEAFTIVNNLSDQPAYEMGHYWRQGVALFDGASFMAQDGGNSAWLQFKIDYDGGTGNDITLTVVPEPAAMALLLLALGGVAVSRRRRQHVRPRHRF